MNASRQPISRLRLSMLENMRMPRIVPRSQTGSIRAVRRVTAYQGRPPDTFERACSQGGLSGSAFCLKRTEEVLHGRVVSHVTSATHAASEHWCKNQPSAVRM